MFPGRPTEHMRHKLFSATILWKRFLTPFELLCSDEGHLWPIAFAVKELTAAEEARIAALVKKAVS